LALNPVISKLYSLVNVAVSIPLMIEMRGFAWNLNVINQQRDDFGIPFPVDKLSERLAVNHLKLSLYT
jgi:hypothetical protein